MLRIFAVTRVAGWPQVQRLRLRFSGEKRDVVVARTIGFVIPFVFSEHRIEVPWLTVNFTLIVRTH
jgi:hypothetical protein